MTKLEFERTYDINNKLVDETVYTGLTYYKFRHNYKCRGLYINEKIK